MTDLNQTSRPDLMTCSALLWRTLLFCSYQSALSMTDTHSTYRDIPALSDELTLLLLTPERARLHPVQVTCLPLISGTGCSSSLCCSVPICFKGLSSCPTAQKVRDVLPRWERKKRKVGKSTGNTRGGREEII